MLSESNVADNWVSSHFVTRSFRHHCILCDEPSADSRLRGEEVGVVVSLPWEEMNDILKHVYSESLPHNCYYNNQTSKDCDMDQVYEFEIKLPETFTCSRYFWSWLRL